MNGWVKGAIAAERRRRVVPGQRRAHQLRLRRRPAHPLRDRRGRPRRAAQRPPRQAEPEGARAAQRDRRRRHGRLQPRRARRGRPHRRHQRGRDHRREPGPPRPRDRPPPGPAGGVRGRRRRGDRQRRRHRPSTLLGALLALAALVGEVGFTLLAAPLLPRLGPTRVAAWTAIIATVQLAVLSTGDIPTPSTTHVAAILYLGLITTALAFVLWFSAVQELGSGRAGLLVGFMPIAAVTVDAALNGRTPSTADLAGTALVAIGIAVGASPERARALLRARTRGASAAASAGTSSTCPAASSSPATAPPAPASRR